MTLDAPPRHSSGDADINASKILTVDVEALAPVAEHPDDGERLRSAIRQVVGRSHVFVGSDGLTEVVNVPMTSEQMSAFRDRLTAGADEVLGQYRRTAAARVPTTKHRFGRKGRTRSN